jgi:hypothetical protein
MALTELVADYKSVKKKRKELSCYTPWRHMGERRYSSYSYLTSATRWG